MGAGAVIRDRSSRVLLVKPTYKDGWEIPGGVVEADESPLDCCARELREELGSGHPVGGLLAVDWAAARGGKPEGLFFVFDGGTHDAAWFGQIRLPPGELSEWKLTETGALGELLQPGLAARVRAALAGGRYLENGAARDGRPPWQ
jgi:8-oxo-dGTP pyrophosphatase MutT (NUDIX family)